jgi:hypothetical protein
MVYPEIALLTILVSDVDESVKAGTARVGPLDDEVAAGGT